MASSLGQCEACNDDLCMRPDGISCIACGRAAKGHPAEAGLAEKAPAKASPPAPEQPAPRHQRRK